MIISTFFASDNPDVDGTIEQVATMMETFNVKDGASWYNWTP